MMPFRTEVSRSVSVFGMRKPAPGEASSTDEMVRGEYDNGRWKLRGICVSQMQPENANARLLTGLSATGRK